MDVKVLAATTAVAGPGAVLAMSALNAGVLNTGALTLVGALCWMCGAVYLFSFVGFADKPMSSGSQ